MSRTRLIDDEIVLDRAIGVFWRHGYAGTSLRDLTGATGLGAASLYHRFGDKEGLFVESLHRYADQRMAERIARLSALASPLGAIEAFLGELIALSADDPDRLGCLLVNTALDGAAMSPAAQAVVRERLGAVEAFFAAQLRRGLDAGLIDPAIDPAAMAQALLGSVLAIRVLARLDPDRGRLRRLAEHALAPLTAIKSSSRSNLPHERHAHDDRPALLDHAERP
jgi:TetR/AcrR family transcriptional regulator, transcriptional repressor for nem operon